MLLSTPSDEESASQAMNVLSCAAWRTQEDGSAKATMHARTPGRNGCTIWRKDRMCDELLAEEGYGLSGAQ